MRLWYLPLIGFFLCSQLFAQQDGGNVVDNVGAGNVPTTAGGAQSGGSSETPEGFGSGGISENLNATEFGERGTILGGFGGQGNNSFNNNGQTQNNFGNARGGQFGNTGRGNARGFQQQFQQNTTRRIRTKLVLPPGYLAEFRPTTSDTRKSLQNLYRQVKASQARSTAPSQLSRLFANSEIQVTVRDRTVTLLGRVGSDRERVLAERMARLEPGVSRVVNELSVVPLSRR